MPTNVPTIFSGPTPTAVRATLERQLAAVVAFLDDSELDALLDVAVARFVDPPPGPMLPDGIAVHQVEARLVTRHGWVVGIVVRQASPHAVAWRWWSGTASDTALSEAGAVARCAAKRVAIEGKKRPYIAQRLLFGRFLAFVATATNPEFAPIRAAAAVHATRYRVALGCGLGPLRSVKKRSRRSMSYAAPAGTTALRSPAPGSPDDPCPRCTKRGTWTNTIPASKGRYWCAPCWKAGAGGIAPLHRFAPAAVVYPRPTRGERAMAGPSVTFDPDNNDADREFLDHWRSVPTPRRARSAGRVTNCWSHISTPELLRRMSDALLARLLPGSYRVTDTTRSFVGMPLCEMARLVLDRQGRRGYTGPGQIAAAALVVNETRSAEGYLTTDDFAGVLLNLARAALTEGYAVAPRTFTSWCRATTLADFRQT